MAEASPSHREPAASGPGVRGLLSAAGDALISVFFPAGCRICEKLLTTASRVPICQECLASFAPVPAVICEVCGRPLGAARAEPGQPLLCEACREKTYAFERARSFSIYEGALVQAILLLKFEQIEPLGAWFAERLAEVARTAGKVLTADVIVPVPLHREREKERGYNQAALISKP